MIGIVAGSAKVSRLSLGARFMQFVFDAPAQPFLEIAGQSAGFPVRRIYCVGRNYAEHAREMGHDPDRSPPFFFSKPADCIVPDGATIPYPSGTSNLHYEAELVVAIGVAGEKIPTNQALDHVWGYASGNDLTRRDLQATAKELRRPWDMAKGFDRSAPIGLLHPATETGHLQTGQIRLLVGDVVRQAADLSEMIWPVSGIVSYLSELVRLEPGDLIMTGTPAGVGAVLPGDTCRVEIEGLSPVTTHVARLAH